MGDVGGGNGAGMLTAAERRIQAVKDKKKSEEKPYDFLLDVKDVSTIPFTRPTGNYWMLGNISDAYSHLPFIFGF